jgi:HSP20 family protein
MSLVRYTSPFEMLNRLGEEMNEWFFTQPLALRTWGPMWPPNETLFTPVDLEEKENEYLVKMDVPGADEKDFKVTCLGDKLTIAGERKHEKEETKGNVFHKERQYGMFSRTIALPAAVKPEAVYAHYKNGVLEVHMPKAAVVPNKEIKVERK